MEQGTPPSTETLHLAGLAAANGPWLAARLRRLAGMSGLSLPPQVVDSAVEQCSLTLRRIVRQEGRPAFSADMGADPAAELGRQQAEVHRQAGLDLPGSLRVLRLMRRCFDDLIRESWIDDKLSRARAHEDVERVFERTLLGLYMAWAEPEKACVRPSAAPGQAGGGDAEGGVLLARREAELRKALETAHKAAGLLRQERARTRLLEGELARLGQGEGPEGKASRQREPIAPVLAAFLEVTGDHLAAVDAAGRFEFWSPGFPTLFGLAEADLALGLDALLPRMAARLAAPEAFLARLRGLMASQAPDGGPMLLAQRSGGWLRLCTRTLRSPRSEGEARPRLGVLALRDVGLEQDALALLSELDAATRLGPGWPGPDMAGQVRQAVTACALEHGLARPDRNAVLDLAGAARQAALLAAPLSSARRVELVLTSDNSPFGPLAPLTQDFTLPAPGDRHLAQELALHLLRDALSATAPGGRVALSLWRDDQGPALAVACPRETPPAGLPGLLSKPAPAGDSLSSAMAEGIPQARYAALLLAQALGGRLEALSAPGRGCALVLRLPQQ